MQKSKTPIVPVKRICIEKKVDKPVYLFPTQESFLGMVLVRFFLMVAVAASAGVAGGGGSRSLLLGLLALLLLLVLLGLLLRRWDAVLWDHVVSGVVVVVFFFGFRVGDEGFTASGSETAEDWDWTAGLLDGITIAVDVGLDTVGADGWLSGVELGRHFGC